jgi:hypothetical protein
VERSVDRRYVLTALTTGLAASLAGCGSTASDDDPDPIIISVYSDYDAEQRVAVTVTDPDGEAVVDGSVELAGASDRRVGEFVPESPDERATYTISATVDGETSKSMEFEAGGASGTTAAWATVGRGGGLELSRARV